MSSARAWTLTARTGDVSTNSDDTSPPEGENLQTNKMNNFKCSKSKRAYRIEDVLNHSQTEFAIHTEWHVIKQSAVLNAPKTKYKQLGAFWTFDWNNTRESNRSRSAGLSRRSKWYRIPNYHHQEQCKDLFFPVLRRKKMATIRFTRNSKHTRPLRASIQSFGKIVTTWNLAYTLLLAQEQILQKYGFPKPHRLYMVCKVLC